MTKFPCRLIQASRLAYAITANGQPFRSTPAIDADLNGAGLVRSSLKSFQSPNDHGIDGCLYGETTDGNAVLAFRGTLAPTLDLKDEKEFICIVMDWLNDGKIQQVQGKNLPGRVHQGFLNSLDNLWPTIEPFGIGQGKPLYITGHRKGGGPAFLAAARMFQQFRVKPAGVFTYAAPRFGNKEFALAYDVALENPTIRYEFQDDIVPHVPPQTGSWLKALGAGQAAAGKIAAIIPPALAPVKSDFDAVVTRMDQVLKKMADHSNALESSVFAGTLQFIDWSNPPVIVPDSWHPNIKRDLHLAQLILTFQFQRIIQDHFSDRGYLNAPCR